ncbi:DeoR/GlpR family DNA-binding transcription regulator [Bacillus sp. FJAT-50079]|uniref:DeoR/GlpR family DNA-binding transcription regulator n=1 Tax=Bacillus sp. FJAT-50079 TaxID=2833577 RepID=UPI001BC8DB22|nr:DeoR/GlpR family DNA-binding transcription regulator [Bacillus sp. FJAT-50079]MBS4208299.1 DeoR/GlpR transcriptional regulator [Bacillus sp. FJAT-50079]
MIQKTRLNNRQNQIYQELMKKGEVFTKDLTERYSVVEMTIRRDFEKLENMGLIKRISGGAILTANPDIGVSKRASLNLKAKESIGQKAIEFVHEGEAIYIDSGTTTPYFAKYLPQEWELSIVTNALNVVSQIQKPNKEVIIPGGIFIESTSSLVGPIAESTLEGLSFDKAFLSASGLSLDQGFSNANAFEVQIKQRVLRQSKEVTVLIDHSKFGQQFLYKISTLKEVDRIITEVEPSIEYQKLMSEFGVDLIICK